MNLTSIDINDLINLKKEEFLVVINQSDKLTMREILTKIINNDIEDLKRGADLIIYQVQQLAKLNHLKVKTSLLMSYDVKVEMIMISKREYIKDRLIELEDESEFDENYEIELTGIKRNSVYNISKELKIPVSINDTGKSLIIRYRTDHPKSTDRNMSAELNQWLSELPIMTPTLVPISLKTACTDSYFRTILNKSKFYVSYKKGKVNIYPYKYINNAIYKNDELVLVIPEIITDTLLKLILKPHDINLNEVMGLTLPSQM